MAVSRYAHYRVQEMPVWYQIFSPLSWYKAHTFFDQNNRECFNVAFRRHDINKVFSEQVAMEMAGNFIEETIKFCHSGTRIACKY